MSNIKTARRPNHLCILPLGLLLATAEIAAQNSIRLGAGYNSEDSFKMGQYSGLTESEAYAVSDFILGRADAYNADTARYWRIIGSNLGLETRRIEAAAGYQGRYGLSLSWQELPHYRFDNPVSTPFLNSGSSRQNLPEGWVGASGTSGLTLLQPSLHDISIRTDREKLTLNLDWQFNDTWSLNGEYRHENKNGSDSLGAIFGSNGGNPRGAILAVPVDYETDTFNLMFNQEGNRHQASFFYRASLFNNSNRSQQWENPFNNPGWAPGAGFDDGAVGELALAPDNRFWQAGFSGVYRTGASSRFTGSLSVGEMRQDENFLPYSNVFSAQTPLPVSSLDGEINTLNAVLNFSTRLGRKANLRMRYTLDQRDNDTRIHLFQRIPGDAASQGAVLSSNARLNRPYSFRNQKITFDTDYRLTSNSRFSLGYMLLDKNRDLVDVDRTREHTGNIKLSLSSFLGGRAWMQVLRSQRNGTAYISNQGFLNGHNPDFINTLAGNALFENDPLLRRFHLADRDRDQLSFNVNLAANDMLSVDVIGKLTRDDFPDSMIGLQKSDNRHLTINLDLDAGSNVHGYTYVTAEHFANTQQGYSRRGGGSPTPFYPPEVRLPGNNWWMETEDAVLTTGAGISWQLMQEKLDLDLDISRSRANTKTSPFSTDLAWDEFADIDSTHTSLSLEGNYHFPDQHKLGLRYRFEKYASRDFAFDNVAVDSLNNIILLGNASPNYSGHIIELTFVYTLPNQE